jgi:hypothetical protein
VPECGREAEGRARGWVAYRVDLPDNENEAAAIVFCPGCAVADFGR